MHAAPLLLGLAIAVLTWFVASIEGVSASRGCPFYWFITVGARETWSEFKLFSLIADIAVWIAVSSLGTIGILAFKSRLKITKKLWILHIGPLVFGLILTLLTWFVMSTYLPKTRMPIFTTYRGYPLPWLVGFGNLGEEPLDWVYQWDYFIVDIVFWTAVASIGALAILERGKFPAFKRVKPLVLERKKLLAASIVLVIAIVWACGVQLTTRPTPTVPVPTPTPQTPTPPAGMPPLAPVSIEASNTSYGFNEMYPEEGYFVLSRRRPATLILILTSTANQTLHLTPSVGELPKGVTAQFDSEFITLETNKQVTVKLTLSASPTAASKIPYDYVYINFTLQEEGYRFKTVSYVLKLTIGL